MIPPDSLAKKRMIIDDQDTHECLYALHLYAFHLKP